MNSVVVRLAEEIGVNAAIRYLLVIMAMSKEDDLTISDVHHRLSDAHEVEYATICATIHKLMDMGWVVRTEFKTLKLHNITPELKEALK